MRPCSTINSHLIASVTAGEWLGPWAFCHAAAAALAALRPGGMRVLLVAGPGGGAPDLASPVAGGGGAEECVSSPAAADGPADSSEPAEASSPGDAGEPAQAGGPVEGAASLAGAGMAAEGEPASGAAPSPTAPSLPVAAAPSDGDDDAVYAPPPPPPPPGPGPLLVLLPLTLGLGRLNPVYHPSLRAVLTWPQAVGVVGGRPGSSLYFVGHQGEGEVVRRAGRDAGAPAQHCPPPPARPPTRPPFFHPGNDFLYIDPHEPQATVADPGAPPGVESYFGAPLRVLPLASVDPSLAIGFYCRDDAEYDDLVARLAALQAACPRAPIACVVPPGGRREGRRRGRRPPSAAAEGEGDGWEML